MRKITLILAAALLGVAGANAQESSPLVLSGSVDTYYKYDFSNKNQSVTSFNDEHNSFALGMVNLIATKEVGKASFVADLSFGPRSDASIPDANAHIQNLFVSYALSDLVSFDLGFMGTFVGYEVISPVDNFNYSTSYMFSNGPFQNAGFKVNVSPSEKIGFMVGLFNDTDSYSNSDDLGFGAQVSLMPAEGIDVYVNFLSQHDGNSTIDLTAGLQLTDAFYLGVNAAKNWDADPTKNEHFAYADESNFWGAAIYPQYSVSETVTLGLRYEHFVAQKGGSIVSGGFTDDLSIESITLSANVSLGELTLIPEVRADFTSEDIFTDSDFKATSGFVQIGAAAVYAF